MVYFLIHFYRERSVNILKCNANDRIFHKALLLSKSFHVHVIGNEVFRLVEKFNGMFYFHVPLLSISKKKKCSKLEWNTVQ